jgi:hypothetical protein
MITQQLAKLTMVRLCPAPGMPPLLAQNENKVVDSSCAAKVASRLAGNPQAASYSSGVHGFQMMGAPQGDEETRARGVGPDSLNPWDWSALLTGSGVSDAAGTKICTRYFWYKNNPKYRIYTFASLCVCW